MLLLTKMAQFRTILPIWIIKVLGGPIVIKISKSNCQRIIQLKWTPYRPNQATWQPLLKIQIIHQSNKKQPNHPHQTPPTQPFYPTPPKHNNHLLTQHKIQPYQSHPPSHQIMLPSLRRLWTMAVELEARDRLARMRNKRWRRPRIGRLWKGKAVGTIIRVLLFHKIWQ